MSSAKLTVASQTTACVTLHFHYTKH